MSTTKGSTYVDRWRRYVWTIEAAPALKLVLLSLAEFADFTTGHNVHPSQAKVAEMTDLGERTVRRYMAEAERLGLIVQVGPRGNQWANRATNFRLAFPGAPAAVAGADLEDEVGAPAAVAAAPIEHRPPVSSAPATVASHHHKPRREDPASSAGASSPAPSASHFDNDDDDDLEPPRPLSVSELDDLVWGAHGEFDTVGETFAVVRQEHPGFPDDDAMLTRFPWITSLDDDADDLMADPSPERFPDHRSRSDDPAHDPFESAQIFHQHVQRHRRLYRPKPQTWDDLQREAGES